MIVIVGDSPRANEMLDLLVSGGVGGVAIMDCIPEPLDSHILEPLRIPEAPLEQFTGRKPRRSGQKIRPTW